MFQITIPARDEDPGEPFEDAAMNRSYTIIQSNGEFRGGDRRITTPDREVVLNLSNSFDKHRLRKHQQILTDITKRCREQEVKDMSQVITAKCNINRFEDKPPPVQDYKQLGLMRTNSLALVRRSEGPHCGKRLSREQTMEARKAIRSEPALMGPIETLFEHTNSSLPPRQARKTPRGYATPFRSFPPLNIRYQRGVNPTNAATRKKLVNEVKINGSIQLEIYTQQKNDQLSPLVLPVINTPDKLDEYFKSRKVNLQSDSPSKRTPLGYLSSRQVTQQPPNTRRNFKYPASTGHVTDRSVVSMDTSTDAPLTAPAEFTDSHMD